MAAHPSDWWWLTAQPHAHEWWLHIHPTDGDLLISHMHKSGGYSSICMSATDCSSTWTCVVAAYPSPWRWLTAHPSARRWLTAHPSAQECWLLIHLTYGDSLLIHLHMSGVCSSIYPAATTWSSGCPIAANYASYLSYINTTHFKNTMKFKRK